MIDLFYWTTPNGYKPLIFLEEAGVPYRIRPVDIRMGEQFSSDFLSISPNNRIPAIVDHAAAGGGASVTVFESGAILIYLAEKTGMFLPSDLRSRVRALEWLFWQVGGLGPMAGQNHHFSHYAPEPNAYAVERYRQETNRLYGVLNRRLTDRQFVAGEYSITDMACYPWIVPHCRQGQRLENFPHLKRWFHEVAKRPAVIRAYEAGQALNTAPTVSEQSKRILFDQTAEVVIGR